MPYLTPSCIISLIFILRISLLRGTASAVAFAAAAAGLALGFAAADFLVGSSDVDTSSWMLGVYANLFSGLSNVKHFSVSLLPALA